MAEDLQALLDRIKNEGVDVANSQAADIIAKAKAEAASILEKARDDASSIRESAERDAQNFANRAEASVKQAMRDATLQLKSDLEKQVSKLFSQKVQATFADTDLLKSWITKAVDTYLAKGEKAIEIELGRDVASIAGFIQVELQAKAANGITVSEGKAFPNGFTIRLDNGRVEHCFTAESVTDTLSRLLRPELAAILNKE